MKFYDENGKIIDHLKLEKKEQILCFYFIQPDDIVLELGARYGTVSCVINSKLKDKNNQVSVEPDPSVHTALMKNIKNNNCNVNVIKGFISRKKLDIKINGYGSRGKENKNSKLKSYTLEDVEEKFNLKFNVLVADCEGCLETFLDENPKLIKNLNKIIFEYDRPDVCNYNKIEELLYKNHFIPIIRAPKSGKQNVWMNELKSPIITL